MNEFRGPTHNSLVALIIVSTALLATIGLMAYGFTQISGTNERVARLQASSTAALCAFRNDLQSRVSNSQEFLATHPQGIPGVPAGVITTGIVNELSTLRALAPLVCPK